MIEVGTLPDDVPVFAPKLDEVIIYAAIKTLPIETLLSVCTMCHIRYRLLIHFENERSCAS